MGFTWLQGFILDLGQWEIHFGLSSSVRLSFSPTSKILLSELKDTLIELGHAIKFSHYVILKFLKKNHQIINQCKLDIIKIKIFVRWMQITVWIYIYIYMVIILLFV